MKVELQGELFILVEETKDDDDVTICAEIGGINIWDWLKKNNGERVRVVLEKGGAE